MAGIGRDIVRVALGDVLLAALLAVAVHMLATMDTATYGTAWRDQVRQAVRGNGGAPAPLTSQVPAPWPEPAAGTYAR